MKTKGRLGNYSTYFHSILEANCLPSPMNVRVPYPPSANYVILMPETDSEAFRHAFVDEFEAASAQGVFRQERAFALLRKWYEYLFTLYSGDEKLVAVSVTEAWAIADARLGAEKPLSSRDGIGDRCMMGEWWSCIYSTSWGGGGGSIGTRKGIYRWRGMSM